MQIAIAAVVILTVIVLIVLWNVLLYRKPKKAKPLTFEEYVAKTQDFLIVHYSIGLAGSRIRLPHVQGLLHMSPQEADSVIRYSRDRGWAPPQAAKAVYEAILVRYQETRQQTERQMEQMLRAQQRPQDPTRLSPAEFADLVSAASEMAADWDRTARQELMAMALQIGAQIRTVQVEKPKPKKKQPEKPKKKHRFDLLEID